MSEKIAYEPHPVTPERKAELRAAGYKIIDAVFAPEGEIAPVEQHTESELTTGKGPGGKWFVKRGKDRVSGPFETDEEAAAEKAVLEADSE